MAKWTVKDIPSQRGRRSVVTGATGGIGFETALELARAGGEVVVVGRSAAKGAHALQKILAVVPSAEVRFELCDLGCLTSVRALVERLSAEGKPVDVLVNNAGVMAPPTRQNTVDRFEIQFGTNHLSHFALTAGLLPLLRRGEKPRVVNLSSLAHRPGWIHFDDLQALKTYSPSAYYCQSKLANMLFTFELQRRSDTHQWGLLSVAAHPGYARTDLIANGPGNDTWIARLSHLFGKLASHSAAGGALPTLRAATSTDVGPTAYFGPRNFFELKGPPVPAFISPRAKDPVVARRLWEISEQLTGASFQD